MAAPLPCLAETWKVTEVREGDLLTLSRENKTRQVRLYGVICPARGQPFHQDARTLTSFMAIRRNVELIPIFNGAGGVTHALVRVEGTREFLNEKLLGYGMAWVNPRSAAR